jgi:hypothetical protein
MEHTDGTVYFAIEEGNRNTPMDPVRLPGHDHPPSPEVYHNMDKLPRLNNVFKGAILTFLSREFVWGWAGTMTELTWHVISLLKEHKYTCSYYLVSDAALSKRWYPTLNNYVKKTYKSVIQTCIKETQHNLQPKGHP